MTPPTRGKGREMEHTEKVATSRARGTCVWCGHEYVDGHDFDCPSGIANVNDPASFWSSLTPSQALALLRAAPAIAGPREETSNGTYRPVTRVKIGEMSDSRDYFYGYAFGDTPERRAEGDAALVKLGYLLVDE